MTFSKALQVFKKWGAIGAPAFTNGRVGEDEQQPSIWFEKALQEFLSQLSDPHEKYESIFYTPAFSILLVNVSFYIFLKLR